MRPKVLFALLADMIRRRPASGAAFSNVRLIFVKRDVDDIVWCIFMRHYRQGIAHAAVEPRA
jgi:hypothetical protein